MSPSPPADFVSTVAGAEGEALEEVGPFPSPEVFSEQPVRAPARSSVAAQVTAVAVRFIEGSRREGARDPLSLPDRTRPFTGSSSTPLPRRHAVRIAHGGRRPRVAPLPVRRRPRYRARALYTAEARNPRPPPSP